MGPHLLGSLRPTQSLPNLRTSGAQASGQNVVEQSEMDRQKRRYSVSNLHTLNNEFLKNRSAARGRETFSEFLLNDDAQLPVRASVLQSTEGTVVVLSGVKDTDQNKAFSLELTSFSQALDDLHKNLYYTSNIQGSKHRVIIPMAITDIRHWKTLELEFNDENSLVKANLYDPKPNWFRVLRDFFMGLMGYFTNSRDSFSYMKEVLEKKWGPGNVKFTEYGLGHQSVFDHHRCGRYSHLITSWLIEREEKLGKLAQAKFSDTDIYQCDNRLLSIVSRNSSSTLIDQIPSQQLKARKAINKNWVQIVK